MIYIRLSNIFMWNVFEETYLVSSLPSDVIATISTAALVAALSALKVSEREK